MSWLHVLFPEGDSEHGLLVAGLFVLLGLILSIRYVIRIGGLRWKGSSQSSQPRRAGARASPTQKGRKGNRRAAAKDE